MKQMGPRMGQEVHRDLQRCGRTGDLYKECLRDVQEMHLGFLKGVCGMHKGCTRDA